MKKKTIICDLDGTLCSEEHTFRRFLAQPMLEAIRLLNQQYDAGHKIIIYTGRSWSEYDITEVWLKNNNVKYHQLICGKPIGDLWIDDRAFRSVENAHSSLFTIQR